MKCSAVHEFLNRYVEGNLPDNVSQAMSEHIRGCEQCAAEEHLLRSLAATLRSLPQMSAPQGFTDDIMRSLWQAEDVSASKPAEKASFLSSAASASGLRLTWLGVRMMARPVKAVRYVPRPTARLRIGAERARSVTKLPLALGFRW